MNMIEEQLLSLNKDVHHYLDKMMKNNMSDFINASLIEKKGYIFIYHQSKYKQKYDFDVYPHIVLTMDKFIELQDLFIFEVDYKVIPLLLFDGHFYKKLKRSTQFNVLTPLIESHDDIDRLIQLCRKENCINIWVMHPNNQKSFYDYLKKQIPKEDKLCFINEKIHLDNDKTYYVNMLLMTKGNHYHEFVSNLPSSAIVSDVLPMKDTIKKWIMKKI